MKTALSVRSHFSIKESILDPINVGDLAKENGYEAVAIVDNMNINAMVDLTASCKKSGIKPIIGCRLNIYDDPTIKQTPNKFWSPKVYVKNKDGIQGLIEALSRANDDDYFYYTPRLGLDELLDLGKTGNVVITTGDLYSLFHHSEYDHILSKIIHSVDADNLFVDLCMIDTPLFDSINKKAWASSEKYKIPCIATMPFLYPTDGEADSLDVMSAVISQKSMSSVFRTRLHCRNLSFKSEDDLSEDFGKLMVKLSISKTMASSIHGNTSIIANACTYKWEEMPVSLPQQSADEKRSLIESVTKGWKDKLGKEVLGYKPSPSELSVYKTRLAYELGVLNKMKFERYFLVVSEIVSWAKNNGLKVGPARGSAAGSLVAYLLDITDVDPIRFNLIFERFINPDRIDLPDIDLDFASSTRADVINHIKDKYGEEYVAGISNYVKLGSASGIREIGKAFGLEPYDLTCTKLMPKEHGEMVDIDIAANMVPEIDKFKTANPEVWGHANKLIGSLRNYSKHAAGIVITGVPISTRAVIERRSGERIANWDRNSVEKWGLVKIDILGLSTLDVIDIAVKSIKNRLGIDINTLDIPLDDDETLKGFSEGKTIGIFQFEGSGVRHLLKELSRYEQLTFDDVSAATALYRPGPMGAGLMDLYVKFKQGGSSSYDHPNMVSALEPTGGVLIYQEQTMQLARDVAGFTMSEADTLRKIIGKKDKDKMADMRDKWVQGCIAHSGMTEREGENLFNTIESFAGYGFNKSHSVSYAIISYIAMWLKVKYPRDFFAASMSILADDKMPALLADAANHGIEIYPPDINLSTDKFEIIGKNLIIPFNRVKGISTNIANAIVEARNALVKSTGSGFSSIDNLTSLIPARKLNSKSVETLNRVGAFSTFVGQKPPRHPDRLKDQLEFLPGLCSSTVSVTRKIPRDYTTLTPIKELYFGLDSCDKCSLKGGVHPTPIFGRQAQFMVITDCPSNSEDKNGKLLTGDGANFIKYGLQQAGLKSANGYFTTLVKSAKNGKLLSNEQINGCSAYLDEEIRILKPAIIVLMGSSVVSKFLPNEKKPKELIGKVIYSKALDANLVVGFNPAMLFFNPDKQSEVDDIFIKVAELLDQ